MIEDEYLLADELAAELADVGATVLGPVPSIEQALALINAHSPPDGAILDLNLGGESALPLADFLIDGGIPLIFTTGYDGSTIPGRFAHVPVIGKPIIIAQVTAALDVVIQASKSARAN